jgi:hypothetical protein
MRRTPAAPTTPGGSPAVSSAPVSIRCLAPLALPALEWLFVRQSGKPIANRKGCWAKSAKISGLSTTSAVPPTAISARAPAGTWRGWLWKIVYPDRSVTSGFSMGIAAGSLPVVAEQTKAFPCSRPTSLRNRAPKVSRRSRMMSCSEQGAKGDACAWVRTWRTSAPSSSSRSRTCPAKSSMRDSTE